MEASFTDTFMQRTTRGNEQLFESHISQGAGGRGQRAFQFVLNLLCTVAPSANAAFQGATTKLYNLKYTIYTIKVNTLPTKLK